MYHFINHIDTVTKAFFTEFESLSEAELHWKAHAESWSIAQHMAHLTIITESHFPQIDAVRKDYGNIPFFAKFAFVFALADSIIINMFRSTKAAAPMTLTLCLLLEKFVIHQDGLKTLIINSSGLLEEDFINPVSASQQITVKLKTAFDIIINHELQHLQRAREILAQMQMQHHVPGSMQHISI